MMKSKFRETLEETLEGLETYAHTGRKIGEGDEHTEAASD